MFHFHCDPPGVVRIERAPFSGHRYLYNKRHRLTITWEDGVIIPQLLVHLYRFYSAGNNLPPTDRFVSMRGDRWILSILRGWDLCVRVRGISPLSDDPDGTWQVLNEHGHFYLMGRPENLAQLIRKFSVKQ